MMQVPSFQRGKQGPTSMPTTPGEAGGGGGVLTFSGGGGGTQYV